MHTYDVYVKMCVYIYIHIWKYTHHYMNVRMCDHACLACWCCWCLQNTRRTVSASLSGKHKSRRSDGLEVLLILGNEARIDLPTVLLGGCHELLPFSSLEFRELGNLGLREIQI